MQRRILRRVRAYSATRPLSVIDEIESVLYPGGIDNDGFGEAWTEQVSERAQAFGQPWTRDRVDGGDDECASKQGQRIHNPGVPGRRMVGRADRCRLRRPATPN